MSQGFTEGFSYAAPSLHLLDLLVGIAGAVIVRLAVYAKGKNARKYRKGIEYGSADGVHNFKCKGHLHGRTGGYAHD